MVQVSSGVGRCRARVRTSMAKDRVNKARLTAASALASSGGTMGPEADDQGGDLHHAHGLAALAGRQRAVQPGPDEGRRHEGIPHESAEARIQDPACPACTTSAHSTRVKAASVSMSKRAPKALARPLRRASAPSTASSRAVSVAATTSHQRRRARVQWRAGQHFTDQRRHQGHRPQAHQRHPVGGAKARMGMGAQTAPDQPHSGSEDQTRPWQRSRDPGPPQPPTTRP